MEKLGALFALLVMAGVFSVGSELDARGDQVRALRERGGTEVAGKLDDTVDRERMIPATKTRPARQVTDRCPVYVFRDRFGRSHSYVEQAQCGQSDWDETLALIYPSSDPDAALNNTDITLHNESGWAAVLRGVGALGVLGAAAYLLSAMFPGLRLRLGRQVDRARTRSREPISGDSDAR